MNKLALGTVQFGLNYGINNKTGKVSSDEVNIILSLAYTSGITVLDTAHAYGNSEQILGDYLVNKNKSFDLISKIPDIDNIDVQKTFKESSKNLKTETLYGYLFHNYGIYKKNPDSYKQLLELKYSGRVKKIGFSLYFPSELTEILDKNLEFDLIQIPYSLFDQRFEPYFEKLKQKKVEIHVRSVFLQGLVFRDPAKLESFFAPIQTKLAKLKKISLETKIPISALCLNFAVLNRRIDKVVIGVDNIGNLEENLKDIGLLDQVESRYNQLKDLKEENEKMILPINWNKR